MRLSFSIIAFNDVVGVACSEECATAAIDDIVGDHGPDADAGMDPSNKEGFCMGCGTPVVRTNNKLPSSSGDGE